jgi:hypothetical protein
VKIDPVSAIPVHLFSSVFRTICVSLFAADKITGATAAALQQRRHDAARPSAAGSSR